MKQVITTQKELCNMLENENYKPRTGNPDKRAYQYEREGYSKSSTIFITKTTNGRQSEQKLLDKQFDSGRSHHNIQNQNQTYKIKNQDMYMLSVVKK